MLVLGVSRVEYYQQKQDEEKCNRDDLKLYHPKYNIDGYKNKLRGYDITYNEISEVATSLNDGPITYTRPLGFLCYHSGARFRMKSGNIFYRIIKSHFPNNIVYHASEYLFDSESLPELLLELIRWPLIQTLLMEQWEIFPPPIVLIILSFLTPNLQSVPGFFKVKQ